MVDALVRRYFGMHRFEDGRRAGRVQPPATASGSGCSASNGLRVEELIEIRPPEGASRRTARPRTPAWARRWPMEEIWEVRKAEADRARRSATARRGRRELPSTRETRERNWATEEITWGMLGVPERELGLLADVAGKDVVELGCGTAYVSAWLARRGARPSAST